MTIRKLSIFINFDLFCNVIIISIKYISYNKIYTGVWIVIETKCRDEHRGCEVDRSKKKIDFLLQEIIKELVFRRLLFKSTKQTDFYSYETRTLYKNNVNLNIQLWIKENYENSIVRKQRTKGDEENSRVENQTKWKFSLDRKKKKKTKNPHLKKKK